MHALFTCQVKSIRTLLQTKRICLLHISLLTSIENIKLTLCKKFSMLPASVSCPKKKEYTENKSRRHEKAG